MFKMINKNIINYLLINEFPNKKIDGNIHKITKKIYSLKSGAQCIVEVEDS